MKRVKRTLERKRRERIQRSRTIALSASEQLQDALRETGKKGALALGAVTLATALLTGSAYALPNGEQVKAGSSTFSRPNATTLNITQSTKKSIINWQGYSIAAGESVRYLQPSSSSVSLNRVTGSDPSKLYGSLAANGQVWVINPNGLLVGPNARVNVGGFLASTLDISDQDFLKGSYTFSSSASVGSILNQGKIQGGYVALLSPSLSNEGTIQASLGKVALASGNQVTLNFAGNDLIGFVVDSGTTSSAGISNTGILAGNSVVLTAKGASDVVRSVVNNTGVIEARTIQDKNGEIVLSGDEVSTTGLVDASGKQGGTIRIDGGFVALGGKITADGKTRGGNISVTSTGDLSLADRVQARGLAGAGGQVTYSSAGSLLETSTGITDVSGKTDGGSIQLEAQGGLLSSGTFLAPGTAGQGGRIDLSGYSVRLFSATVDASGGTQGGLVRIGGAFQGGKEPDSSKPYNSGFLTRWGTLSAISSAEKVFVNDTTVIDVSADKSGSAGGTAVIWSNAETTMLGRISAAGKASGGYVEVSSAERLRQTDILKIDTGRGGELLLDPKNIVIGDSDDITGWTFQGILGKGYATNDKDKDVSVLEGSQGEEDSGDNFGVSVSLNSAGDRLAVGADCDEGSGNSTDYSGAVYLFSFTDTNFSGGSLQGIIGKGYTGGKNVNVDNLASGDFFGRSVSLNGAGDRLAVGAYGDDGYEDNTEDSGAVYLFNFTDTNFSGGSLQGIIGQGYANGKNIDVPNLASGDNFGISVSLNDAGNRLAVGAASDDGFNDTTEDSGAVYLFSFTDMDFSGGSLQGIIGKGYADGKNVGVSALENGDCFGVSVSLNGAGDRLAIGADWDDGFDNGSEDSGAVYLFSFTDTDFSGGSLQGIIGKGYADGKNVGVSALESGDSFGVSVSLNGAGDRLAIGADWDDGVDNSSEDSGAVYLFSFTDTDFNGGSLQGTIGKGYTGGKSVDVSNLETGDYFGRSVSFNGAGNRLAVGAWGDDGADNSTTDTGAVYLFSKEVPDYAHGDSSSENVTLLGSDIATWLSGGSNLTLQANNDITLNAPVIVNNATGNGGDLTLAAGRSLLLNGNITTDNGNLTLVANDTLANGVVDTYRDAGAAVISQDSGTVIDAGTAAVTINLRDGSGKTYTESGDITLSGINAATLAVTNAGLTAGSDVVQDGGSICVTGTTILAAGTNNITLNTATNDFSTVSLTGKNVTLVDATGLNLSTTTASGNLNVKAGGAITDSGTVSVTGTTTLNAGTNSIALDTATNNFTTVSSTGKNVTLVDATGLNLGTTTASGNLNVTAGGPITDSGTISVTGTTTLNAGTNSIALDTAMNNFTTVSSTGKNVTLVDATGLNLGTTTASGNLNVTAGGPITDSGTISVTGTTTLNAGTNSIALDMATNNFSTVSSTGKNVTLVDATGLNLGTTTASGNLNVTAGGPITDSGTISVTGTTTLNAGTNSIALDTVTNNFSTVSSTGKNVTLVDATGLNLGTTTASGNLNVTAGGPITDSGTISVTGTTTLNAGTNSIALDTATNNFTTVSSTGKNVTLVDATGLNLGTTTASGNLNVTAGGPITDSGTISVTGTTTLNAGTNSIALDTVTNNFSTVSSTGKNVTLVDATGLNLGTTTASGNLNVTAGGPITDSGTISVTGTTTLNAGTNNIALDTATNNFTTVSSTGKNVTLVDATGLNLGTTTASGSLNVTAGGPITDSGTISVTGTTTLNAGTNNIALDTATNNFTTVSSTGKNVTLVDATGLNLSTTTASGNLNVKAGGAITDSGTMAVTGLTTLNAGTNSIALDTVTNDFSTVSLTGKNVTLVDATGLNLSTTAASGNLNVKAGGAITDSGTVAVTGLTTLNAGVNSIALDTATNDFSTVSLTGKNVTLVDATGLNLSTTTASGNLNVKAGGDITDSGTVVVTGLTTVNAGTNDITLNTLTNDFGTVSSTGGNVTLVDANALNFGVSTLSGAVGITSNGTLTLMGALNAGTNNVTLSVATVTGTINAGSLTLTASSEVGGVSANLLGSLDPAHVNVISAPGKVLLNGTPIYP